MKPRLVHAAADRLASPATGPQTARDEPLGEEEVLRVLARIARTGRPADWLRAAELIGRRLGMFGDRAEALVQMENLSDEERAFRIEAILERARARRATPDAKRRRAAAMKPRLAEAAAKRLEEAPESERRPAGGSAEGTMGRAHAW
jgi:hypothetical protein